MEINLTAEDQKAVKKAIEEIENSLVRIESESELIKETAAELKKKYKIPVPASRKAAQYNLSAEKKTKAEVEFDIVEYLVELSNN